MSLVTTNSDEIKGIEVDCKFDRLPNEVYILYIFPCLLFSEMVALSQTSKQMQQLCETYMELDVKKYKKLTKNRVRRLIVDRNKKQFVQFVVAGVNCPIEALKYAFASNNESIITDVLLGVLLSEPRRERIGFGNGKSVLINHDDTLSSCSMYSHMLAGAVSARNVRLQKVVPVLHGSYCQRFNKKYKKLFDEIKEIDDLNFYPEGCENFLGRVFDFVEIWSNVVDKKSLLIDSVSYLIQNCNRNNRTFIFLEIFGKYYTKIEEIIRVRIDYDGVAGILGSENDCSEFNFGVSLSQGFDETFTEDEISDTLDAYSLTLNNLDPSVADYYTWRADCGYECVKRVVDCWAKKYPAITQEPRLHLLTIIRLGNFGDLEQFYADYPDYKEALFPKYDPMTIARQLQKIIHSETTPEVVDFVAKWLLKMYQTDKNIYVDIAIDYVFEDLRIAEPIKNADYCDKWEQTEKIMIECIRAQTTLYPAKILADCDMTAGQKALMEYVLMGAIKQYDAKNNQ